MRAAHAIWKYEIPQPNETGRSWIDVPEPATFLSVGLQGDQLVVWALVDLGQEEFASKGARRLIVLNTGMEVPGFPSGARFLGTVTTENGIVWHIFDGDSRRD